MDSNHYQILRKLQQNAEKRDPRKGNTMADALMKAFSPEKKLESNGTVKVTGK